MAQGVSGVLLAGFRAATGNVGANAATSTSASGSALEAKSGTASTSAASAVSTAGFAGRRGIVATSNVSSTSVGGTVHRASSASVTVIQTLIAAVTSARASSVVVPTVSAVFVVGAGTIPGSARVAAIHSRKYRSGIRVYEQRTRSSASTGQASAHESRVRSTLSQPRGKYRTTVTLEGQE
jgi:hypothetical protein